MRIRIKKSQGLTTIDCLGLVLLFCFVLGIFLPKIDWYQQVIDYRDVAAKTIRKDTTNVVIQWWKFIDRGPLETDFEHVPDQLTNQCIWVNGHAFQLQYRPDLDGTNHWHYFHESHP